MLFVFVFVFVLLLRKLLEIFAKPMVETIPYFLLPPPAIV